MAPVVVGDFSVAFTERVQEANEHLSAEKRVITFMLGGGVHDTVYSTTLQARLDHLLRDLELLDHPDLVVHLHRALNQFHLRAVEIRKVELVDLKLLNEWR